MTSLAALARKNNMNPYTVRYRINDMGWDKMDALIVPPNKTPPLLKVTDKQIMDIERLGLSIGSSAYLLGLDKSTLSKRIKRMKITWRGKGRQIGAKQ